MPNRNIIKNFKDFKNLKPHRNLNIFHEASIQTSQKTENKLKVHPKSMYIPQKVSEVTIPITNKYGKLKVKIKTSFCRNELPLTSEIL